MLPATCLGCGLQVPEGASGGAVGRPAHLGLCLACRGRLARPAPGCSVCGEPGAAGVCGECRRRPPPFAALRAAWSYRGPLPAVVRGLKFRRLDYLGAHLARDLAELVAGGPAAGGPGPGWDLVVPVPLHWRRRWLRGYNQAERIARPLARLLGAPCAEVLRRRRATRPQTGLARAARLSNPQGAFVLRRGRWPSAAGRVLLVDDVVTTGATLRAAAEVLRESGAREVVAVAAARTPEGD